MRILIIGGNGTIGRKVAAHFSAEHEVLIGGRKSGDVLIDIGQSDSIEEALRQCAPLDAILCIAGEAKWDTLDDLSEEDHYIGIRSKLMGQVNVVRIGRKYVQAGGCITLSTGILADKPVPLTTSAALVNGAVHSFVKAVDLEIEKGIRVNVVSLGLVEDAYEKYKDYFPGHQPISMRKAVDAYVQSVEGQMSGAIIRQYE